MDSETKECEVVVREHGGRHSLLYAAGAGMVEAVAEAIAAGDDVNARNSVCMCVYACVSVRVRVCI